MSVAAMAQYGEILGQFSVANTVPPMDYYRQTDVPVRSPPRLIEAAQLAFKTNDVPLPTPPSFGYFRALDEPARLKPALATSLQMHIPALGPVFPTVSFSWIFGFTDPVRLRPRLPDASQIAALPDPFPFVSFSWMRPVEDLVRVKPGLRAADQRAFTHNEFPFPLPPSFGYFVSLSEPQRFKPGLLAAQQPAEPTVFVPVYYPFATTGPLFGNGTKNPTPTFWKGRKK